MNYEQFCYWLKGFIEALPPMPTNHFDTVSKELDKLISPNIADKNAVTHRVYPSMHTGKGTAGGTCNSWDLK